MIKRLPFILLACAALPMINTPLVYAAENTGGKADRTILLYDCGADLEKRIISGRVRQKR